MTVEPNHTAAADVVDERGVVLTAAGRRRARARINAVLSLPADERDARARQFLASLQTNTSTA